MKRTLFSTATIVGLSGLIILSDVGDMPRTVEKIGLIALGTADVLIAAVLLVLGIIHRPPP